jgi:hypothetical protein
MRAARARRLTFDMSPEECEHGRRRSRSQKKVAAGRKEGRREWCRGGWLGVRSQESGLEKSNGGERGGNTRRRSCNKAAAAQAAGRVTYQKGRQGRKGNGYRKLAKSKSLFSSSQFATGALYCCPSFLKSFRAFLLTAYLLPRQSRAVLFLFLPTSFSYHNPTVLPCSIKLGLPWYFGLFGL